MIKTIQTKLGKKIDELNLTNQQLVDKLSDITNNNFNVVQSDSLANAVTPNHVFLWQHKYIYPSDPLVRQLFSLLITKQKDSFSKIIFESKDDIQSILDKSYNKYKPKDEEELKFFKKRSYKGHYLTVARNPQSKRVTNKDLMECIFYILINKYLYVDSLSLKNKSNNLNLKSFNKICSLKKIDRLLDKDYLLQFFRNEIDNSNEITDRHFEKMLLLYLLKRINFISFFKP